MPQIFKALATVTVWILFVFGCLSMLGGFGRIISYALNLNSGMSTRLIGGYFVIGILSLIFSLVGMKIRKSLD